MNYRFDIMQIVIFVLICLAVILLFFSLIFDRSLRIFNYSGMIAFFLLGVLCIYTGFINNRRGEQNEPISFWYPKNLVWTGILIIFLTIVFSVIKVIAK